MNPQNLSSFLCVSKRGQTCQNMCFWLWCRMRSRTESKNTCAPYETHSLAQWISTLFLKGPSNSTHVGCLLKGIVHPKITFPHEIPKTCMPFFLLQNTKDILMSVGNQTVWGPVGFHNIDKKNTIEVNRTRICLVTNILKNIFFFLFHRGSKACFGMTWGWVNDRMSLHTWLNSSAY